MTGLRLTVLAAVWCAGFVAPDLHLALLYVAPALLLAAALWAGRYPGEVLLARIVGRRRRPRPETAAAVARRPRATAAAAARGGLLLARSLAGRGPPASRMPKRPLRLPGEHQMTRYTILLAAAALLLPAAAASAHVSLHPNALPAGSNPTINVRVPDEEDNARTVKVDMQIPPGFTEVSTELPAGWKAQTLTRKLSTPVKTDNGTVTEEVAEIIWTAPRGGGIPPGSFLDFPILTAIPDGDAGQPLTFKVIQTYSNGDIVRWIDPSLSAMHPAPTVDVTAKGGVVEDLAGSEAGPGPVPAAGPAATTTRTTSSGASKGLGVAALVIGGLGLLVGLGALSVARRRATA